MIIAEYIWLDNNGDFRSKARSLDIDMTLYLNDMYTKKSNLLFDEDGIILNEGKTNNSRIPKWNYDGSSTGQASGNDSEIIIVPRNYH